MINTNLAPGMPPFVSPCVLRLISAHGNLCVSGTIHRPLVYVGRAHYYQLIIHDHSLSMHVYHHPSAGL
jgi:hypothetical protein